MARTFAAGTNVLRNASVLGISAYPLIFSVFFRVPNVSGYKPIMAFNDVGAQGSFILSVNGSSLLIQTAGDTGGGVTTSAAASVTTNTWHHAIAMWFSATERYICLDGVVTADTADSITFPAALDRFSIGGEERFSHQQFVGDLSHAAVWYGAKFGTQTVKDLSAGKLPYHVHFNSLRSYYRLNNATGTGEQDSISNYHMTLTGSSAYQSSEPTMLTKLNRRTAVRANRGAV